MKTSVGGACFRLCLCLVGLSGRARMRRTRRMKAGAKLAGGSGWWAGDGENKSAIDKLSEVVLTRPVRRRR